MISSTLPSFTSLSVQASSKAVLAASEPTGALHFCPELNGRSW